MVVWIVLFVLMLLKYGYYGFAYFPILDDWIQYGGFILYDNIFTDVIVGMGTYTTRPFASISDPYIWGQFWGDMRPAFFIITLMHFFSMYFIYRIFENNKIKIKLPFLIIYGLLPLGTEATYWISASSRLVVGMFFASLSLYCLSSYMTSSRHRSIYIILFIITNIMSMGYYEQVSFLSFFGAILLFLVNREKIAARWHIVLPFISVSAIGAYYKIFSNSGGAASRAEFINGNIFEHIVLVIKEIIDVWITNHLPLYTNGFIRGIRVLVNNRSYVYLFLIILVSIVTMIIYRNTETRTIYKRMFIRANYRKKIFLGIILFLIPMVPNMVLNTVWICNRNTFPSFVGLALMFEGLIEAISTRALGSRIKSVIIFSMVLIFLTVNVSELTDYKMAGEVDRNIVEGILAEIELPAFYDGNAKTILFNAKTSYVHQNSYYRDHIHNVTASDWALTGAVRAIAENTEIQYITPIMNNSYISEDDWTHYILLGITEDMEIISLGHQLISDNEYEIVTKDLRLFGRVFIEDEGFLFTTD